VDVAEGVGGGVGVRLCRRGCRVVEAVDRCGNAAPDGVNMSAVARSRWDCWRVVGCVGAAGCWYCPEMKG